MRKIFIVYADEESPYYSDEILAVCADYESAIQWLIDKQGLSEKTYKGYVPEGKNWLDVIFQEQSMHFVIDEGFFTIQEDEIFSKN